VGESGGGEKGGHIPVLLAEVLAAGRVRPGQRWIDGTFGRGGHTRALLEQGALVLGLDQDSAAEAAAGELEKRWPEHFRWKQRNFKDLRTCSREQGFSFRAEGPLDMRMNRDEGATAADLVNELAEDELSKIFYEYGGERESRRVARALAARRRRAPFRTTTDLAAVVAETLPHRRAGGIHPATQVFQALRIAVNHEQEALVAALPQALEIMKPEGVLAVISFHSGEDRVVKGFMRERSSPWLDTPGRPNTLPNPRHHLREVKRYLPSEEEIGKNPRARSARLRVGIRNEEEMS